MLQEAQLLSFLLVLALFHSILCDSQLSHGLEVSDGSPQTLMKSTDELLILFSELLFNLADIMVKSVQSDLELILKLLLCCLPDSLSKLCFSSVSD